MRSLGWAASESETRGSGVGGKVSFGPLCNEAVHAEERTWSEFNTVTYLVLASGACEVVCCSALVGGSVVVESRVDELSIVAELVGAAVVVSVVEGSREMEEEVVSRVELPELGRLLVLGVVISEEVDEDDTVEEVVVESGGRVDDDDSVALLPGSAELLLLGFADVDEEDAIGSPGMAEEEVGVGSGTVELDSDDEEGEPSL